MFAKSRWRQKAKNKIGNQYVKMEKSFDSLFAFESRYWNTFIVFFLLLSERIKSIQRQFDIFFSFLSFFSFLRWHLTWCCSHYGTSLVNNGSKSTASDVCCYQLRMLLPSIVHCVLHFITDFIQPQMLGDIFENAILHCHIDSNGHIYAGISQIFTTSKYNMQHIFRLFHFALWCSCQAI